MCERAVGDYPWVLKFVLDKYKTKEMCERAVEKEPYTLDYVPDQYKMQEICDAAVEKEPWLLEYVPDWFVTQQQVKLWHDFDDDDDDDDEIIEWYDSHQKQKAQKAKVKEELMPIAWHPSRWWNWCVPEDEKKRQKNCGSCCF